MKIQMRTSGQDGWTVGTARTGDWRTATVRVYNRHHRQPGTPLAECVALIDPISDDSWVVQLGYGGGGGTALTPRTIVRVVSK